MFDTEEVMKPGFLILSEMTVNNRSFDYPSWLNSLPEPKADFKCDAPSYREITKIINKIKSCGSPCSIDQMSIIVMKKMSKSWKHGFTILVHKKGNFRP